MSEVPRSENGPLDYISALPEPVVHHIFSFLLFKDILRCSLLSKTWKRIWLNYPNIDLILQEEEEDMCRSSLCPIVYFGEMERALDHCLLPKACVQKFRLFISARNADASVLKKFPPLMDTYLGAAVDRSVSEIVLDIYLGPIALYSFSEKAVVSDSLKVLELMGCVLEDSRVACIYLPRLQRFKTSECTFSGENVLSKILCGCSNVEFVQVSYCDGVGSFLSVSSKPRLKCFRIRGCVELERIEINVPSLETLECSLKYPCQRGAFELASCTTLKHLQIKGATLSGDNTIQSLLSKLPGIEDLELHNCRGEDRIQISSVYLKKLVLSNIDYFPGAEIDTPNLVRLDFRSVDAFDPSNRFSSWNVPKVGDIHMVFNAKTFQSACRSGLKGFLMQLTNYGNLKLVVKSGRKCILHEKLYAVSFSSLNKLAKKAKPGYVAISSRTYASFTSGMVGYESGDDSLFLISSSSGTIELFHQKMRKDSNLKRFYSDFRRASIEEREHEADSPWASFANTHSNGYHTATIILVKKTSEEMAPSP
ncbi:unnamed protein product [Cuscuta campestris]|uniref:F-box domain-containing protein n=1 Tax=Cuscuta campestris TaxID=132261 RepID=A0A484LHR4_9ASTE|nr:unnamed protein product [Cuscuta campestris]